jgi:hypothetical protein
MINISDKGVEKNKTYTSPVITFFEDRAFYEIMCKNTAETNGTQMTI